MGKSCCAEFQHSPKITICFETLENITLLNRSNVLSLNRYQKSVPQETVEVIAQSIDINNLSPDAELALAPDVEYRMCEIVQPAEVSTAQEELWQEFNEPCWCEYFERKEAEEAMLKESDVGDQAI
ncbi:unnamed protein product [Lactuca saligna]|uniref:TATA box binding protein associated factor (TAF) histone-like fold domain-containing protein n=1 Tax=Lactuca saligna TaxID=75948 RepID=A0AA35VHG7_LACSI|nr:unnamed protein product [Lactuca saligna]